MRESIRMKVGNDIVCKMWYRLFGKIYKKLKSYIGIRVFSITRIDLALFWNIKKNAGV